MLFLTTYNQFFDTITGIRLYLVMPKSETFQNFQFSESSPSTKKGKNFSNYVQATGFIFLTMQ